MLMSLGVSVCVGCADGADKFKNMLEAYRFNSNGQNGQICARQNLLILCILKEEGYSTEINDVVDL